MSTAFLVGERLTVRLDASEPAVVDYLRAEMDPYGPVQAAPAQPDAVLEAAVPAFAPRFRDVQNPANDDGSRRSTHEGDLYLVHDDAWCRVRVGAEGPALLTFSSGFPLGRAYGPVLRPALHGQAVTPRCRHRALGDRRDRRVRGGHRRLVGKRKDRDRARPDGAGRALLSDKWTILGSDRTLATFPIGVGVRRWVLPYLPRLRAALPSAARAQLGVAGVAAQLSRPVQALRSRGRLGDLAGTTAARAVALADRAALSPSQLITAYGQGVGWVRARGSTSSFS